MNVKSQTRASLQHCVQQRETGSGTSQQGVRSEGVGRNCQEGASGSFSQIEQVGQSETELFHRVLVHIFLFVFDYIWKKTQENGTGVALEQQPRPWCLVRRGEAMLR